ncbi:MAG: UPF0146 family protein [Methanoregula sp.]|nr:UPF0146 family protein [Methanoregula sp.]
MGGYKHIEKCVGTYIAAHYRNAVEIGIGRNTDAARIIHDAGPAIRCTDIHPFPHPSWLRFTVDDIFEPNVLLYTGADVLYAIRPAEEMVPPLIGLAARVNCDLLIYHLGFESYGDGGEQIDCGVILHRYYRHQNPSKSVD